MKQQKRVAAIHDISCFGKCSLTVALPILSACGIETSIIPTAVLSTHTGGFTNFTYRDLTDDILPIAEHWHSLGLHFDSIYTGYLGSFEQINILGAVFDLLSSSDTLLFVDPVMGDDGKLYTNFSPDFPHEMKKLVQKADFLIPNITEACLLLDRPYQEGPYTEAFIQEILEDLSALGPARIVLTGVYFDDVNLGAASYENKTMTYSFSKRIPGSYHGSGDIFGSTLLAALLQNKDIKTATQIAIDFTTGAIERTRQAGTELRNGVDFEEELPCLLQNMGLFGAK